MLWELLDMVVAPPPAWWLDAFAAEHARSRVRCSYASGIYFSHRIAKAAVERADFLMIVAGDLPDSAPQAPSPWASRFWNTARAVQLCHICRFEYEPRLGEAVCWGVPAHSR